ncbi:hypothetical protein MASR2M15_03500 [Anaerolineales bacterium]
MQENDDNPVIMITEGDESNKHYVLSKREVILGRDDSADIIIPNRQISRQHIMFKRIDLDHWSIIDLESKNGTWVNGLRLEGSRQIFDGDEVHIALVTKLRFIGSGATAPVTQNLPQVVPSERFEGRLRIDLDARQVFLNGEELNPALSLPQYRLLELLYINSGKICTRDEVIQAVWPDVIGEGVSEQAIDALVRRLRDRLNEVDDAWQYIVTVRGHGFRLDNPTT